KIRASRCRSGGAGGRPDRGAPGGLDADGPRGGCAGAVDHRGPGGPAGLGMRGLGSSLRRCARPNWMEPGNWARRGCPAGPPGGGPGRSTRIHSHVRTQLIRRPSSTMLTPNDFTNNAGNEQAILQMFSTNIVLISYSATRNLAWVHQMGVEPG